MEIGKVASHNDLGGYISHWLENTVWIVLTFGEASLSACNKASLLKGRFGGIVEIMVKRGI